MTSNSIAKGILKAIAILMLLAITIFIIIKIQSVIGYLVIAGVMALIGRPIISFLSQKLKFPDVLAVLLTMGFIVLILFGLIGLFVPLLSEQGENLSLLDLDKLQEGLKKLYNQMAESLGASPKIVSDIMEEAEIEKNLIEEFDVGFVPKLLNSILEIISSFGIGLFSILFITFFFMKDRKLIERTILKIVPPSKEGKIVASLQKIRKLLSRYFVGLTGQVSILFIIYSVTLLLVGVENAIVIAFLCALFNIVPYLGPIVGAVVMVVFTMLGFMDEGFNAVALPKAGYVLIGVTIGQLIDNFFSQPLIFANSVKSHPLEIFLVIIMSGLLFGVVGMITAVPTYTVIKVILKEFWKDNRLVKALTRDL